MATHQKPTPARGSAHNLARELGVSLVELGIELSISAGYQPPAGLSEDQQAQAILRDAFPRLQAYLEAGGLI
jgi:hypothetical protein